jgi:RimJ/RimL family protein N-acetyltransferase
MEIVTARLLIREFQPADHSAIHAYASDPGVSRYTDWGPNNPETTTAFLAEAMRSAAALPRTRYALAVVDRADGKLIGSIELRITAETHCRGEMGYVVARPSWGQGLATEAAAAILRFAFDEVGLHKVTATCDPANAASARVLSKIGMQHEGNLHDHVMVRGQWRDRLLFAAVSAVH